MAVQVITIQLPGAPGPAGPPNNLTIGTVTTGAPGTSGAINITGQAPNQVLNFTIPAGAKGDKGDQGIQGLQGPQGVPGVNGTNGAGIQIAGEVATYSALPTGLTSADAGKAYIVDADGKLYIWSGTSFPSNGNGQTFVGPAGPANTLTVGTVTTGESGASAVATITGTAPNQVLNLTIPQGPTGATGATGADGPANTLQIGSVTTGQPGSSAGATVTGSAPNQTLNLTIPTGATGAKGDPGQGVPVGGSAGQVLSKKTATSFDTQWVTPVSNPTIDTIPSGSTITVIKQATWPARPTIRTDVIVIWKGPDPSPSIVESGTGGMLDNVDMRFVTP